MVIHCGRPNPSAVLVNDCANLALRHAGALERESPRNTPPKVSLLGRLPGFPTDLGRNPDSKFFFIVKADTLPDRQLFLRGFHAVFAKTGPAFLDGEACRSVIFGPRPNERDCIAINRHHVAYHEVLSRWKRKGVNAREQQCDQEKSCDAIHHWLFWGRSRVVPFASASAGSAACTASSSCSAESGFCRKADLLESSSSWS